VAKIFTPDEIGQMLLQVKATPQPDGSVVIAKGDVPPEALDVLNGESSDTGSDANQPPGQDAGDMFSGIIGGGNAQPYK